MQIRPQYASLIIGTKVGAGTQGPTDLGQLDRCVDRILVLDPDLDTYLPRFGARCWLRIVHDGGNWKNAAEWARHSADEMARAYVHGCRDLITGNEQIALEGLGETADDYRWLNTWGVEHVTALRSELANRGCHGVRIWGPALSPGHGEDDGIVGYRLLVDYLRVLDGIAVHCYWNRDGSGFVTDQGGSQWFAGRIERVHRIVKGELGLDKPWAVTEFNRGVNRADNADVVRYANECKAYYRWLNSLDYVVAGFTFLYCTTDTQFLDLTWTRMSRMTDYMAEPWDRLAEMDGATPAVSPEPPGGDMPIVNGFNVGAGVAKVLAELGDVPTSDEIWENPKTMSTTFTRRHVLWYNPASNEVVVVERKR